MSSIVITTNANEVAQRIGLSARQLRLFMADAIAEANKEILADYKRATRTWEHQPNMINVVDITSRGGEGMVGTDDEIFGYVDAGTRAHWIVPRRAKALRFWTGGSPKTTPNALQSGAGRMGSNLVFSMRVWHPGIKPRRFTENIQKRAEKRNRSIIEKHMKRWAQHHWAATK